VTLTEIANRANVSITTVHRVFSGKEDVHPDTARRIWKIANDTGYIPMQKRKNKVNGEVKTGVIGLLLSGLSMEFLEIPQNLRILSYIENVLRNYNIILSVASDAGNGNIKGLLEDKRWDGIILMGDMPVHLRDELRSFPCVGILGYNYLNEPDFDWIMPDYRARARIAIEYFKNLGHEHIGFLNPIGYHFGFQEVGREFAWLAESMHLDAKLFISNHVNDDGFWKAEDGRNIIWGLVDDLIKLKPEERPTGLFVANDELAMDVYSALNEKGVKIGKELTILSSDNVDVFLNRLYPRPATIDINYPLIAELAVERLMKRIKNADITTGVRIMVPPKLVLPDTGNANVEQ
jgi:LacI family transcriptional regulator